MSGGGGGGEQNQPVQVPRQAYKKEEVRTNRTDGSNKKALGSAYLQQRRAATPVGDAGFGGTKPTLG
jgi:hypothetical protein